MESAAKPHKYWNIKERLNLRRTLTSFESALEGKLFVEFVALIYLSYIKKKMEDAGADLPRSTIVLNSLYDAVLATLLFSTPPLVK